MNISPIIENTLLDFLKHNDISELATYEAYNQISFPINYRFTFQETEDIISYLNDIKKYGKEVKSMLSQTE